MAETCPGCGKKSHGGVSGLVACLKRQVAELDEKYMQSCADWTHLEAENEELKAESGYQMRRWVAENAKLLKANAAFLKAWKHAGPQGSGQFEKFDVAVRLAEQAEKERP